MQLDYSDRSNLFIEAQKISTLARGWAHGLARVNQHGQIDVDYLTALSREVEGPARVTKFGPITDSNETLWVHAEAAGCEVRVGERRSAARRSGRCQRDHPHLP